jgi:hypothetical protein|tara:strand:- start:1041 stop:1340 length:300 start_codon:yes stop_codon:yes gene_type:complete
MNIRILGNQPEPSLTMAGYEIVDFEVRTRDEELFKKGQKIVNDYIAKNPTWEHCQLFISDPMTVGIYPQDSTGAEFNNIVLELEALGFYGKAAGYREVA